MEGAVADHLEQLHVALHHLLGPADDDGDLAALGKVHAARDGCLNGTDARGLGTLAEVDDEVVVVRRVIDPRGALRHRRDDLGEDRLDRLRRRQAGEGRVDARDGVGRTARPARPRGDERRAGVLVEIEDGDLMARLQEVHGDVLAEVAEADVCELHG